MSRFFQSKIYVDGISYDDQYDLESQIHSLLAGVEFHSLFEAVFVEESAADGDEYGQDQEQAIEDKIAAWEGPSKQDVFRLLGLKNRLTAHHEVVIFAVPLELSIITVGHDFFAHLSAVAVLALWLIVIAINFAAKVNIDKDLPCWPLLTRCRLIAQFEILNFLL